MENINNTHILWGFLIFLSCWGIVFVLTFVIKSEKALNAKKSGKSELKEFVLTNSTWIEKKLFFGGLNFLEIKITTAAHFLFPLMAIMLPLIVPEYYSKLSLWSSIILLFLNIIFYLWGKHDLGNFYDDEKGIQKEGNM